MTREQEKAVEALSLAGKGFAVSETIQWVRDGYGQLFAVMNDGQTIGPLPHMADHRSLQQLERETYA